MRGSWDLPRYYNGCQVLHWKSGHKIGLKAQRAMDFGVFNFPRILVMMPEQRKHGCSRPFSPPYDRTLTRRGKKRKFN
jgi:hypothetical protein